MIFGSVCSGIEAASVAWSPLGWRAAFFSEIDGPASAVLAHHYPDVPNLGDMTRFQEWPDAAIDVLCGGTPCQSFSVAGLRGGLADPRGNLALTFLAIADRYRPRWIVWENVPGVLSSGSGRDFAAFLGGLGQLGYGWAYRVLDAQYVRVDGYPRAVPQRRRRVFVVGCLGSWASAAAVLFEPESLRGHSPPRREAGKGAASLVAHGSGSGGVANTLGAKKDGGWRGELDNDTYVAHQAHGVAMCLTAKGGTRMDAESETLIAFDARQRDVFVYGDRAAPLDTDAYSQAIAFDTTQITSRENRSRPEPGGPCHTLAKGQHAPAIAFQTRGSNVDVGDISGTMGTNADRASGGAPVIAYGIRSDASRDGEAKTPSADAEGRIRLRPPGMGVYEELAPTLDASQPHTVATAWAVRRMTPLEAARLQGFPDDYFDGVRYRGKPLADGPIYKMLGNSWAIPPVRWIGRRIEAVEALRRELALSTPTTEAAE